MPSIYGKIDKVAYFDQTKAFGIVKIRLDYSDPEIAKYRSILFVNVVSVLSSFDREPVIDEEYAFDGEFEQSLYGMQFRASSWTRKTASTEEGIIAYLSSDLFPTIGPQSARKVYSALGEKAIELILKDKRVLDKTGLKKAQKDIIYEVLVKEEESRTAIIGLLNLGFSLSMSNKLKIALGDNAYAKIKANPYILMYEVEGFGFLKADSVASRLGIVKSDPIRLKALVNYSLMRYLQTSGDTFILKSDLVIKILSELNLEEEVIKEDDILKYLYELSDEKKVYIEDDTLVYTYQTYHDEVKLSHLLCANLNAKKPSFKKKEIEDALNDVMKYNNIKYTDKQKEAIIKAIEEPIVIITGGPGTGKSTIIKGIVDTYSGLFNNHDVISDSIALCAPTGRAAKRLKEVTIHPASTIHKLLHYTGDGKFEINEENKLDCNMLIVDEISMVDQNLARHLFSSLNPDVKIVLVGDADQLPSVQSGNVLHDLINTKEITTIKLDQIHRQKEGSSIISLAHFLKDGEVPYDIYEAKDDRRFIQKKDEEIIPFIINTVKKGLASGMDMVKDIQVLVPTYKGELGIEAINKAMQEEFNPKGKQVEKNGRIFREHDKVIQLINRSEKNIMNGDIGYIESIEYANDKFVSMSVVYDIGRVEYSIDELEEISLAYAISIHKAQGSEFSLVLVPFTFKYYHMLKRKLIYTACTRAKKYLILIGNIEALRKGIVQIEEERKTKLTKRIKDNLEGKTPIFKEDEINTDEHILDEVSPYDFM